MRVRWGEGCREALLSDRFQDENILKFHVTINASVYCSLPVMFCSKQDWDQICVNIGDLKLFQKYPIFSIVLQTIEKPFKNHLLLLVKDSGIGIPEKYQERIFERFYVVDKSRSRSMGGTGLGLSIVKHILMAHDAAIKIKSRVNQGTKIFIFFPI